MSYGAWGGILGGTDEAKAARRRWAEEASREPVMRFCEGCERCVEAEDIHHVAIPGGEGETRAYCFDCYQDAK